MEIKNIENNKRLNENNIDVILFSNNKLGNNIRECGNFLKQTKQGNNIIYNCCNSKYCYLCSEKKREHTYKQLNAMLEHVLADNNKVLSFTVSPFNAYNSAEIKQLKSKLDQAFKLFVNYSKIKKVLVGTVKKFEIAINNYEVNHSYNVHLHAMLIFKGSFQSQKYYVNRKTMQELFAKALKESFNFEMKFCSVDYGNLEKTAKYFSKSFLSVKEELSKCDSMQVFKTIYNATDKVKMFLVSSGLRDYQNKAKQELESFNDEEQQQECIDFVYSMNNGCYVMYQREPVSEP